MLKNLCCQLGYLHISILRGQIGQNVETTPCRQLGYYEYSTGSNRAE